MVKINTIRVAFLVIALMIAVSSYSVSALQLYDLSPFDKEPIQGIKLGEGEGVQFEMFGGKHFVIIDDIDLNLNDTDVKVFVFSKQVMKISLRPGVALRLDIDRDGATDVIVHLLKMEASPEKRVSLIFESTGISTSEVTGSAARGAGSKGTVIRDSPNKTLTVVAVLVIALSLFLYSRKKKRRAFGGSFGKKEYNKGNSSGGGSDGKVDSEDVLRDESTEIPIASDSNDKSRNSSTGIDSDGDSSVSAENIKIEATENL